MKWRYVWYLLLLLGSLYYFDLDGITSGAVVDSYVADSGSLEVVMCPGCESSFVSFLSSATKSIDCALFDIGLESVQNQLLRKDVAVRVVTDDHYLEKFDHSFVRSDRSGLMHNKFCIIDGSRVSTGSMNPTFNGVNKNNNNIVFVDSPVVSELYLEEFEEMWNGEFKKGSRGSGSVNLDGILIDVYFCPEDNCALHVKEELSKAESSIDFMTFSFIHKTNQLPNDTPKL